MHMAKVSFHLMQITMYFNDDQLLKVRFQERIEIISIENMLEIALSDCVTF